jgi:hypothetical protein
MERMNCQNIYSFYYLKEMIYGYNERLNRVRSNFNDGGAVW